LKVKVRWRIIFVSSYTLQVSRVHARVHAAR
jgi:hypothetical protein